MIGRGFSPRFTPFLERMQAQGLPSVFIETFAGYYQQLASGQSGLIAESAIAPLDSLPDIQALDRRLGGVGARALSRTVLIKLNGGLGTSMGLERAKSLAPARDDLTFLDVIARQARAAGVALVLMNSFATEADSLKALERYPEIKRRLPSSFVQHKAPKIVRADLSPASWPANPELEWCPPGHGDLYTALVTSGTLAALIESGYRYAFVSNADNLGATIDTAILGYLVERGLPFLMEAADRTEMDRKGGHLSRAADGRLLLRELAQCPVEDMGAFQDINRHRFFNTNNLWLDLRSLDQVMRARDNRLGLPMIRNAKTVDPRDPTSTPVYQLETAMGAAVSIFDGAEAIRVPRSRFLPVKTTNELLAVRSDAYVLTPDSLVVASPKRAPGPLVVDLDPAHFEMLADLDARFPRGAPSLVGCSRFEVQGDFRFGGGVVARGEVRLLNESGRQIEIEDRTVLEGSYRF